MSEFRLMPRLDNHGVRRLIGMPDLLQTGSISERMEAAGTSVSYASSGGSRADAADLTELQEQIVALAKRFGFPNEGRAAGRASFDAECAQRLVEAPIISGGEALRDDVWAFVAACIVPEVVLWRFEDGHADRFHGGLRNTFQRLWLRARSLDRGAGALQRWQLVEALSEDAAVQIVERPSIGADPVLARAIAEAWLATAARIGASRMEDVTRRAVRRIRIDNEITCLGSLGEPELASRLQGYFDEAAS